MRIGYAVASLEIAGALRRVTAPFPLSVASLVAAEAYVNGGPQTTAFEAELAAQVDRSLTTIVDEVGRYARNVWDGYGNFVLMDFGSNADRFAASLRAEGVAVRAFSDPELAGCIRFCALDDASTSALIAAVDRCAVALEMREAYA
jgi:histidinol-phosphate aminotransferase